MIFRPELARLIVRGGKTQTRRPVKPGEDRCRYKPGLSYSVQPGRGREGIGRVVILAADLELAGALTFDDARAEGFRSRDAFKAAWVRLHDAAWVRRQEQPADPDPDPDPDAPAPEPLPDDVLAERFDQRHADRPVWAIRFELDTSHRPRLLAPSAQAMTKESARDADDHGYTHDPRRALRDEPEAVDAATLEHYAADAHERFAGQPGRRAEHARRQIRTQGERAKRLAAAGVDVAPAFEQLARHLDNLERQRRAA